MLWSRTHDAVIRGDNFDYARGHLYRLKAALAAPHSIAGGVP